MQKSPCLMGTLSQGVTLRYLKWKEGECFLPAFAHQAPGLPDFTCSTPSQRHWLTALRVWGHCSICTSLVSCLEWLPFSFPDKEMEAGWHWWRWTTVTRPLVQCPTHTPHILLQRWVIPTSAQGKAKETWPRACGYGWTFIPYCQQRGQALQSQGHSCLSSLWPQS